MDEVWASFKEHTFWYKCELVEAVVKLHGAKSDRRNLKEFKNELANFKPFLNGSSDQRRKVTMILKLEEDFEEFSHTGLKQVCLALCDLLETTACPLDVQEGCVKIAVTVPAVVAEDVFPFLLP